MKVYVAGAWAHRHSPEFQSIVGKLVRQGHTITYEWWLHDEDTAEKALEDLRGVRDADVLVVAFLDPQYPYRGCWVEFGYALGLGIPIYVVGSAGDTCIFMRHPNVHRGLP